jgi:hypothetical protein
VARKAITEDGQPTLPTVYKGGSAIDRVAFEESALALLEAIPEAGENDDIAIYAQLLAAESVEDFEVGGHLPAGRDLVGRRLKVEALSRRVSDIEDPDADAKFRLPFYVIPESVDVDSGEAVRWQTSSPGLVIPLAKLHMWGQLPAVVRIVETGKEKAGRSRALGLVIEIASPRDEG